MYHVIVMPAAGAWCGRRCFARATMKGDASERPFAEGDVVLAKIRGFPAWPGIIMGDGDVPSAVLAERPAAKGKALYTVRFFPDADYHWATARDLTLLTPEAIDTFLAGPQKKTSELYKAYKVARDPTAWNAEKNRIVREAEAALENVPDPDEDEDAAEEEDEEDEPPKPARKRKAPASAPAPKKPKVRGYSARADPQADSVEKPEEVEERALRMRCGCLRTVDPATKRVREWRHKLQRFFLSKDGVMDAADMENQDATFKTVESYEDMTPEQLKTTKVGKVMKRINQLPDIPRDDEFHFRERAGKLVVRWGAILGAAAETAAE